VALSDIVNVAVSVDSVGVAQAGFGVPMILSHSAAWTERTRSYTSLDGVALDFASTTPEYKTAALIFSQSPKPSKIMIGRCANKPTINWTITVVAVANLFVYTAKVNGVTASFTSDGTATNDEIAVGLAAAITTAGGGVVAASATGSVGAKVVTVVPTGGAGAWTTLEITDFVSLKLAMDHTDPGIAADLDAILLEDKTWYSFATAFPSKLVCVAAAAWAEANKKIFVYSTQDSECATVATGSATDVMKTLHTSAYYRSIGIYHPNNGAFAGAAWMGRCLPLNPGSETWALKTLAGVAAVTLTATQRTNILAKSGNCYETVAGVNITENGTVASGEYLDVVRFRDWLEARMAEAVFALLVTADKVPYDDTGIAQIEGVVRGVLKEAVATGGMAASPKPTTTVPAASDVSGADKTARILRNVKFGGTLAGAVHAANISGAVSV
jgi:hypothetical protein